MDAKTRLDQADSDLASFQASNQVGILTAQLDSQPASLTDYLNHEHQLQVLTQDTQDLLRRLDGLQSPFAQLQSCLHQKTLCWGRPAIPREIRHPISLHVRIPNL